MDVIAACRGNEYGKTEQTKKLALPFHDHPLNGSHVNTFVNMCTSTAEFTSTFNEKRTRYYMTMRSEFLKVSAIRLLWLPIAIRHL